MDDITVYTAVFGNYDTLQPAKFPPLCFTDGKMPPVTGWGYRTVFVHKDPKWANRHCKLLAHEHLDTEYSIYHDGNIELLADPYTLTEKYLKDVDIAVFAHPERDCIYDEAVACIKQRKAPASEVEPQMARYRAEGYPAHNGLAACWVLIRRHTEAVAQFNRAWWDEYNRGAKRDQLSFNYVCRELRMKYAVIPGNLFKGTSGDFRRAGHKRSTNCGQVRPGGIVVAYRVLKALDTGHMPGDVLDGSRFRTLDKLVAAGALVKVEAPPQ